MSRCSGVTADRTRLAGNGRGEGKVRGGGGWGASENDRQTKDAKDLVKVLVRE